MRKIVTISLLIILVTVSFAACSGSDEGKAKSAAKEYCSMLESEHDEIEDISFTGESMNIDDTYYFEVKVEFSDQSRLGEVECTKDNDGSYYVEGLDFTD